MTIPELLSNDYFRYNQTFLSKKLNVTRSTLRKYMNDTAGIHHHIEFKDESLQLYTNQTNKIKG